jgi:hypothetical protein
MCNRWPAKCYPLRWCLTVSIPKTGSVGIAMPKRSRRTKRTRPRQTSSAERAESRASEAVTIAWTSAVTGAFIADLIVIAAHLYARSDPDAQAARALEAIMLLSAAVMGAISLALLAVVWRTRQLKPPRGYMVFAILVAVAPMVALVGRLLI